MLLRKDTKYFLFNGKLTKTEDFPFYLYDNYKSVYEVIKYDDSFFFAKEHGRRLENSIKIVFPNYKGSYSFDINNLSLLFEANKVDFGNIRIDFFPEIEQSLIFLIPFFYPPEDYYKNGVSTMLQFDERPLQNAKVYNAEIREKANKLIADNDIFETILVNKYGEITEGSRSNVFMIKGRNVFTAPKEMVLQGITRSNMILFLQSRKIPLIFKPIKVLEIKEFEAVFLTGTSIGALPCKNIGEIYFDTKNVLLKNIYGDFNK